MEERRVSQGFLLQKRRSLRHPALHITNLDYADDIAVLDSSKDGKEATTKISNFGREAGLGINSKKINTMVIGKFHYQRPFPHDEMLELTINVTLLSKLTISDILVLFSQVMDPSSKS